MRRLCFFLLIALVGLLSDTTAQTPDRYFDTAEVTPKQVVNNTDTGRWESKTETIKVGDHTVKWAFNVKGQIPHSMLSIDGEPISFAGIASTNDAEETSKISLSDYSDEWRQIKLYELYPKEFITITMGPKTCTGLSCGIATQLIYDTSSKTKTFFGTFRTDWEVRFFRFTGEVEYFYLSKRFGGDPHGEGEASVTYDLYKLRPDGGFEKQNDGKGDPYLIKHTHYPDIFDANTRTSRPTGKADILTQHWIEKID